LGNSLKEIQSYAFYHCPLLSSINLPNSLVKIGDNAFSHTGLLEVRANWQVPITTTADVFDNNTTKSGKLYIPRNTRDQYKQTTPWSLFDTMLEM
jgi:hypothetical protein